MPSGRRPKGQSKNPIHFLLKATLGPTSCCLRTGSSLPAQKPPAKDLFLPESLGSPLTRESGKCNFQASSP